MVQATPQYRPDQDRVPVRAFSSLTRHDAAAVRAAVHGAGGDFTVEEHDDYDGYLSLIVSPADEEAPAYLVSGRTGSIDVAEVRGDRIGAVWRGLSSIDAGLAVLRRALERNDAGLDSLG